MVKRNEKGQFIKGTHWRNEKPYYDKEFMSDLYVTQKKSCAEIASEYGVTPGAIIFWLKKHNIPRRNTSETRAIKHWGSSGENNPMYHHYGEKNPNYKGGKTPERQATYSRLEWKRLEKSALDRAKGACEKCGDKNKRLHVHHIEPLKSGGKIICDINMLAVLCPKCHSYVHSRRNVEGEYLQRKGNTTRLTAIL